VLNNNVTLAFSQKEDRRALREGAYANELRA